MITVIKYNPGLGKSDHLLLEFNLTCYSENLESNIEKRNFHKGNYKAINEELTDHVIDANTSMKADEHWNNLVDLLATSIKKHIPVHKKHIKEHCKQYIDREVTDAVWKKHNWLGQNTFIAKQ